MTKMLTKGGGKANQLEIEIRPYLKLDKEVRNHMNLLPSTCLVHHSLLYFVSGFMNYKAE